VGQKTADKLDKEAIVNLEQTNATHDYYPPGALSLFGGVPQPITRLSIKGSVVTVRNAKSISHFANSLKSAHFDSVTFEGSSLLELSKCNLLEDLTLRSCRFLEPRGSLSLSVCKIERLNVAGIESVDAVTPLFNTCARISHLTLTDTDFGDEHAPRLSQLKNLSYLHLGGTPISGSALLNLPATGRLRVLYLDDTGLQSSDLAPLVKQRGLRELVLSRTKIDDSAVDVFLQIPTLTRLELKHTEIGFETVLRLTDMGSLRLLKLQGVHLTEEEKLELGRRCPEMDYEF